MARVEYWQRGESIDYTNKTADKIYHNNVVVVGEKIGIAGCDIGVGEVGSVHIEGVFKASTAASFTAGSYIKYDSSAKEFISASDSTDAHGWVVNDTENSITSIKLIP